MIGSGAILTPPARGGHQRPRTKGAVQIECAPDNSRAESRGVDAMADDRPGPPKDPRAPRLWLGCDLFAWLRLLWLGRFSFGLPHLRLLPLGTLLAAVHTFLRYAQEGLYGARIRGTPIAPAPLFILGHWRAGPRSCTRCWSSTPGTGSRTRTSASSRITPF